MFLIGNVSVNYDRTSKTAGAPHLRNDIYPEVGTDSSTATSTLPSSGKEVGDALYDREGAISLNGRNEVHRLARTLTEKTMYSTTLMGEAGPFNAAEDSQLNPKSPNFSSRAWAKSLLQLQSRDPERYPERTAGMAFRNLNVNGFGKGTDYQKTVGNGFLGAFGALRHLVGLGTPRKIQILQDFEGIVESGEMLVVLGPPGR